MQFPQFKLYLFSLLLLLNTACDSSGEGQEIAVSEAAPGEAAYYFEHAKQAEGSEEKIQFLNAALKAMDEESDSLLINLLDFKIYYHKDLKQRDSAYFFADSLIRASEGNGDFTGIGLGYYRLSKLNFDEDDHIGVFKNAFESRRFYLAAGDSLKFGRRSMEMANAQVRTGDYTGARESATEALRFLEQEADSVYLSSAYNAIAITYRMHGFHADAIREYENALRYFTSRDDSISYLNNKALALQDLQRYEEAVDILRNLLETEQEVKKVSRARLLDNLAYTKWLQDPDANVEEELLTATQMRRDAGDRDGLLASYDHLTQFYERKNDQQARQYALNWLETAELYNNPSSRLNAMKYLLQLPGDGGEDYAVEYVRLNDSLNTASLQAKNSFAKIRFDEERKLQEIAALETHSALQQLETQRLRNTTSIILLVVLLVVLALFFLIYYLRQRYRKEKVQEVYRTESRISRMIHDELANDIFNVMSSLEQVVPEPVIDKLEKVYLRTRDISRENSEIDTGPQYLQSLVATLSTNTPPGARLILRGENEVNWEKLSKEKKLVLYRVLQELMVNMKKHSNAKLVAVTFAETSGRMEVNYSDTGTGLQPENFNPGNGLRNVQNRLASINGKISFEPNENGFKAMLAIPLK
ncbi:ATP-binding protein [Antarcticibacterium flavum]|uniref:histidine kinase n=1 Tax=Antarcticibacterium flavum TaxID=2058175 RepID=A0A5B7X314_9FLAO|nr:MULTISPECIES: ATP-binding protein [Antarcticibacterium]MCM4160978.1 ATP-binding protein [Antarcticibacterium sp. W02-3]QCY69018.1 ATP-binding protein [Antarcticibacterium flavum]